MARERAWWTQRRYDQVDDATFTRELIGGSGLAVTGATVLRCIGRLDWQWSANVSSSVPMIVFGILVTDDPNTDTLTQDTGLEWLFWTELLCAPTRVQSGDTVGTESWWRTNEWDVEGRRVLGPGESVWLLGRLFNRDAAQAVDRLTVSRVLMLMPDA